MTDGAVGDYRIVLARQVQVQTSAASPRSIACNDGVQNYRRPGKDVKSSTPAAGITLFDYAVANNKVTPAGCYGAALPAVGIGLFGWEVASVGSISSQNAV